MAGSCTTKNIPRKNSTTKRKSREHAADEPDRVGHLKQFINDKKKTYLFSDSKNKDDIHFKHKSVMNIRDK